MRLRSRLAVFVIVVAAGAALAAGLAAARAGDTKLVRPSGRAMPKTWQRWVDRSLVPTVRVLLHELGHLFDLRKLNNSDRGRFRRILRQPKTRQWWKGTIPLAEQFAEAYSFCARYRTIVSIARFATYHYRPTSRQHVSACTLMRRAARDRRPPVPPRVIPIYTKPDPVPPPQPPASPEFVPGRTAPSPTPGPVPVPVPAPIPAPPPPLPPLPGALPGT
jgi:hypothetical protein